MTSTPQRFLMGEIACSTHTISQMIEEVRALLRDKTCRPRTVLTVNAHIFNLASRNESLRQCLNSARIVTADGMGVVWAARLFGIHITERCNMTEAFRAFLQACEMPCSRALLIGCAPAEAEAAAERIQRLSSHCRVVRACSGYLSDEEYRRLCAQFNDVDFILLGMGTPRTEFVANLVSQSCPTAIVWGIGGGTVRILSGTMREAPVAWRRLGLQWLHRLLCQPKPLWRRYVLGNPLFVLRILRAVWISRRRDKPRKEAV